MAATWQRWHETALPLLVSVYVEEEARVSPERDHLAGRWCLFPDVLADWTEARDMAERVARFALFLASARHTAPTSSINEVSFEAQRVEARQKASERCGYLADIVRAQTLVLAHEDRRALEIIGRQVRAVMTPKVPHTMGGWWMAPPTVVGRDFPHACCGTAPPQDGAADHDLRMRPIWRPGAPTVRLAEPMRLCSQMGS